MQLRHELKYEINYVDMLVLRQRLKAVMKPDPHVLNGEYRIRSLYFDTPTDKALNEKLDGVNLRDKYRIRLYNNDTSFISLEKKSKINGLCRKQSERISAELAQSIVSGDINALKTDGRPLCTELYREMTFSRLMPKTIVDYTREPFIYAPGNVRVTIDRDIRTGLNCTDLLNDNAITIPAGENSIILEVKWDEFLPDIIKDTVGLDRHAAAFSKYARCRIYG